MSISDHVYCGVVCLEYPFDISCTVIDRTYQNHVQTRCRCCRSQEIDSHCRSLRKDWFASSLYRTKSSCRLFLSVFSLSCKEIMFDDIVFIFVYGFRPCFAHDCFDFRCSFLCVSHLILFATLDCFHLNHFVGVKISVMYAPAWQFLMSN